MNRYQGTILAVALGLAGCTTWTQPLKTEADFNRDMYDCQRDAAPVQESFRASQMRSACMRVKGWRER